MREICRNLEIWQGTSVDVGSARGFGQVTRQQTFQCWAAGNDWRQETFQCWATGNDWKVALHWSLARVGGDSRLSVVPELNLKIWNWLNFMKSVFDRSVLHTLNCFKTHIIRPGRSVLDWKIYQKYPLIIFKICKQKVGKSVSVSDFSTFIIVPEILCQCQL